VGVRTVFRLANLLLVLAAGVEEKLGKSTFHWTKSVFSYEVQAEIERQARKTCDSGGRVGPRAAVRSPLNNSFAFVGVIEGHLFTATAATTATAPIAACKIKISRHDRPTLPRPDIYN